MPSISRMEDGGTYKGPSARYSSDTNWIAYESPNPIILFRRSFSSLDLGVRRGGDYIAYRRVEAGLKDADYQSWKRYVFLSKSLKDSRK